MQKCVSIFLFIDSIKDTMKSKKEKQFSDYLKANRKANREIEIETFGHSINYSKVQKSKKIYDRKKQKADFKRNLPFGILIAD